MIIDPLREHGSQSYARMTHYGSTSWASGGPRCPGWGAHRERLGANAKVMDLSFRLAFSLPTCNEAGSVVQ